LTCTKDSGIFSSAAQKKHPKNTKREPKNPQFGLFAAQGSSHFPTAVDSERLETTSGPKSRRNRLIVFAKESPHL
jgi:hypothetical protein